MLVDKFGVDIVTRKDNRFTNPVFFAAQQGIIRKCRKSKRNGKREMEGVGERGESVGGREGEKVTHPTMSSHSNLPPNKSLLMRKHGPTAP